MSFPRYPKYKDSGVEWLGEVPEHWEVIQSRRLFRPRNEMATESDRQVTASQQYGILYQDEFVAREGRRVVETIMGTHTLRRVMPNDFVISLRSFQGGIEWSQIEGAITFHYVVLTPIKHVYEPFFAHLFKSMAFIHALRSTTNLIRDGQDLRFSHFVQVSLPIVPEDEQIAITAFLDRETAKIDELVAEQRRLIELLKEKRQAVISHAVTKGLNPNVPLRPSGIEWLGDVPEHWDVVALKRGITKIGQGWSPQCENDFAAEGEWGVVKVGCCNRFNMVETEQKKLPAEITPMIEYEIQDGDILMSRGNTLDLVGMAAMATNVRPRLLLSDLVYRFRAVEDQFDAAFLVHSLRSKNVRTQVECEAVGSSATMKKVSQEVVRNFFVCKPPVLEQHEIAKYLASMSAEFDNLEAEAERGIKLLQERRTALISAAVTGKIDVRTFVKEERVA